MGLSEINYADECSKIGCGLRRFFGFHGWPLNKDIDGIDFVLFCIFL